MDTDSLNEPEAEYADVFDSPRAWLVLRTGVCAGANLRSGMQMAKHRSKGLSAWCCMQTWHAAEEAMLRMPSWVHAGQM